LLESACASSGRKIRKEEISCPAGKLVSPEISPRPPYMPPGTIVFEEGAALSEPYLGIMNV
jgi:hypothetical protein